MIVLSANCALCLNPFCNLKWKIGKNRCCCCFQLGLLNDQLFKKALFIQFTMRVFRERLSVFVCPSFPFDVEGGIWDLIVLIPDNCRYFFSFSYFNLDDLFFVSVSATESM